MAVITIIYCLIVIIHVFYAYLLANKIIWNLKKKLLTKLFQLQPHNYQKKEILNIIVSDTRTFSDYVLYVPNQLFYMGWEAVFAFIKLYFSLQKKKIAGKITGEVNVDVLLLGIIYFLLIVATVSFFNYSLYLAD